MNFTLQDCQVRGGQINLGLPDNPDNGIGYLNYDTVLGAGAVTWRHTVFAGVSLNLNPTYYWRTNATFTNQTVNCDLQVTAEHNLFQNARWLILAPIPATAGNWTFRDNLFDRVQIYQQPEYPLDFEHNGYWRLLETEVFWSAYGYTNQLRATATSDGLTEVFLNQALPYTNAAYGNYYLTQVTPLYQAGSRTASEAGLTEYTTFANQTKDPSNQPVNIGLHYVAATNNLSLITHNSPLDSDSDGVPDYVEAEHGTDLHNAMTDGVTNDTYNVAYDDVDLSGNGLVGRIKKALGLNPLDRNNPLTLKQIITGEEPDIATFEVPLQFSLVNYDSTNSVGKLNLMMDGQPLSAYYGANSNGLCRFVWDTRFNPPGYHNLQVEFGLNHGLLAGPEPDPTVIYANGGLIAHTSLNELQFDPFYCEYNAASGAMVYAKLTDPAASYTVELKSTNGTHIKWLAVNQTSTTGAIELPWDLTDDNGQAYTGNSIKVNFTLNQNGKANWLALYLSLFSPDDGDFTVAYAGNNSGDNQDLRRCIQWTVVDQLIGFCNVTFCFDHFYESTFNTWSDLGQITGNPGHLSTQADADALLHNLSNVGITSITNLFPTEHRTKNFYFFGHNKGPTFGTMNNDANVQRSDVAQALGNLNFTSGENKGKISTGQQYRFVFLDACSTADDADWAHAFGIHDKITEKNLQFRPGGVQAFVGWQHEKRVPLFNYFNMSDCESLFWSCWQNGIPLDRCIYFASQNHPPAPFDFLDLTGYNFGEFQHWNSWEISKWGFGWSDPKITIYGYAGITRTGFAPGYDNSTYYIQK
jgi:hypothetical protein